MTLEERVRYLIGRGGGQLPTDEYETRIDEKIEAMSVAELLHYISEALEPKL